MTVKLPPQIEVMPVDVLYRTDKCQRKDYDSTTESHIREERGYNPKIIRMKRKDENHVWQSKIALDGGGKCEWKLSTVRIGIQLMKNIPLTQGKNPNSVSYVFAFDEEFYSGGGLPGQKKEVQGNLEIKTDLFPMVYINHAFTRRILICLAVMSERRSGADISGFITLRRSLLRRCCISTTSWYWKARLRAPGKSPGLILTGVQKVFRGLSRTIKNSCP